MAITLLIAGPGAGEPVIGPGAADQLAELGITRVALLRDSLGIGVVLEGWAFDPARVHEAARAVFPERDSGVRILHEIEHVAVLASSVERRA
jgi:hypothetical protein